LDKDDWYGLHERLETPALLRVLRSLGLDAAARWDGPPPTELMPHRIATHLAQAICARLLDLRDADRDVWDRALRLLGEALDAAGHPLRDLVSELPNAMPRQLLEVLRPARTTLAAVPSPRPDLPLSVSTLLTGSRHSPSLVGQIEKELASADRADWLVSFIKFSGIRPLREALQRFTGQPTDAGKGPRLRIATTSYLGATDPEALAFLVGLPNTEVRVSYDTHRTRLHAKAYVFHRRTGFGAAYIGSANVSRVALDQGLEWTARISQQELPHLWRQVTAGFEMHWEDGAEFEPLTHDDLGRFEDAVRSERGETNGAIPIRPFFDLRPYGFQQQILDDLAAERASGRHRHLVIAATGTGKTLLAAFDYQRVCREAGGSRLRLLFLAHRKELLEQARHSFREVLRDDGFGELVVDGGRAQQGDHLFCSVQSWRSQELDQLDPAHFDYVVLDEAHHGSASSYQAILRHLRPRILLGLTATPERMDSIDIRADFGGSYSHELRLPDAVEARLLAPFHYYGIDDHPDVDLSKVRWSAGRYEPAELEKVFGGNDARALWILRQLHEHVANPRQIRALGFCVNQAHAGFMAKYFNDRGIPSIVLTAESPRDLRERARQQLVARQVNVIFTVDLYNEGVDIPEVDTVLLLRPTESLTVYLQQLGRGLRLHPEKAQLTVLDFIAPQNRQFRFAQRFRALSLGKPGERPRIDKEVEEGFGWLPSGCLIRLTKKAQQHVLDNIRAQIGLNRPRLEHELRSLMQQLGRRPCLQEILDHLVWDSPEDLLAKGPPCELLGLSSAIERKRAPGAKRLQRGLRELAACDDPELLFALVYWLSQGIGAAPDDPVLGAITLSLLWGHPRTSVQTVLDGLRAHPHWSEDVRDVAEWRLPQLLSPPARRFAHLTGPLRLHSHYTREQILIALGVQGFDGAGNFREGVLHVPARKVDAFFVTIDKDAKSFSPQTMYEDYALKPDEFHWQSQSRTTARGETGQRYLHHAARGYTPLLFLRRAKLQPNGLTEPFCYMGPLEYLRHSGDTPISIVWRLKHPMPPAVFEMAHRLVI